MKKRNWVSDTEFLSTPSFKEELGVDRRQPQRLAPIDTHFHIKKVRDERGNWSFIQFPLSSLISL